MRLRYLRIQPMVAWVMDDRILPNANKRTGSNVVLHFTVRQSSEKRFRFSIIHLTDCVYSNLIFPREKESDTFHGNRCIRIFVDASLIERCIFKKMQFGKIHRINRDCTVPLRRLKETSGTNALIA